MSRRVEIENLWRIKLHSLKPLLDASKELRDLPPEEKKRSGVKWALRYRWERYYNTEEFNIEVIYHFKPRTNLGTGEEILEEAITFRWSAPDGSQREQEIELEYRESNLGKGYREYYFRDKSYNLCRTLYSDRWGLYSRWQLQGRVVYRQQNETKYKREETTYFRAEDILTNRKGRHLLWGEQLTPFAKKCLKAKEYLDTHPMDLETALLPRQRGRKPKEQTQGAKAKRVNIAMN